MKKALWTLAIVGCMAGMTRTSSAAIILSATDDDTISRSNSWTANVGSSSTYLTVARAWGIISKPYIKFSTTPITTTVTSASLTITLVNNYLGGNATIQVYALNDGVSGESSWTETSLTYSNAPQNMTDSATTMNTGATLLGTISLNSTDKSGTAYTFSENTLVDLLNSNKNGTVTLVLLANTDMLTSSGNQVQFASSENTTYGGPTLTVTTAEVPEPASVMALGGGMLLLTNVRRKQ